MTDVRIIIKPLDGLDSTGVVPVDEYSDAAFFETSTSKHPLCWGVYFSDQEDDYLPIHLFDCIDKENAEEAQKRLQLLVDKLAEIGVTVRKLSALGVDDFLSDLTAPF